MPSLGHDRYTCLATWSTACNALGSFFVVFSERRQGNNLNGRAMESLQAHVHPACSVISPTHTRTHTRQSSRVRSLDQGFPIWEPESYPVMGACGKAHTRCRAQTFVVGGRAAREYRGFVMAGNGITCRTAAVVPHVLQSLFSGGHFVPLRCLPLSNGLIAQCDES